MSLAGDVVDLTKAGRMGLSGGGGDGPCTVKSGMGNGVGITGANTSDSYTGE